MDYMSIRMETVLHVILTVLLARVKRYVQDALLDFIWRKIKPEENVDHVLALVSPAKKSIPIVCLVSPDSPLKDGNVETIQELNSHLSSALHPMSYLVILINLLARLLRFWRVLTSPIQQIVTKLRWPSLTLQQVQPLYQEPAHQEMQLTLQLLQTA